MWHYTGELIAIGANEKFSPAEKIVAALKNIFPEASSCKSPGSASACFS